MSKRWTMDEDVFLAHSGEDLANYIAEADFMRGKGAGRRRWNVLKESGALDCIEVGRIANGAHYLAVGHREEWDEEDRRLAEWMQRNASSILAFARLGGDLNVDEAEVRRQRDEAMENSAVLKQSERADAAI